MGGAAEFDLGIRQPNDRETHTNTNRQRFCVKLALTFVGAVGSMPGILVHTHRNGIFNDIHYPVVNLAYTYQ